MNQNPITLESENLRVDSRRFKVQQLETRKKAQIDNYRFKLGFNVYEKSGKLTKPLPESFLVNPKNLSEVSFVENNLYRSGVILPISGNNPAQFYCF